MSENCYDFKEMRVCGGGGAEPMSEGLRPGLAWMAIRPGPAACPRLWDPCPPPPQILMLYYKA